MRLVRAYTETPNAYEAGASLVAEGVTYTYLKTVELGNGYYEIQFCAIDDHDH